MSGKITSAIIDFLFPPACSGCAVSGEWLCETCRKKIEYVAPQVCPACEKPSVSGRTHPACLRPRGLDGVVSIAQLKPPLNSAIYDFKYHWVSELKSPFGMLMSAHLAQLNRSFSGFTIVPIPLDAKRYRWRGFNQAALLAREIAPALSLPIDETLLIRSKNTAVQADIKSRKERGENLSHAFTCNARTANGARIVLIDDVITTGATLTNAAQTLKQHGAQEVWGLTLARRS